MKKFAFTLRALLNVKVSMEKQKTAELAAQNRVIFELEEELAAIRARLKATQEEYTAKMQLGGMSPGDAVVYGNGFRAMHDRIQEWLARIQRAEEVKQKLQTELTELMGERKALENLQEKQYQAYLEEVRREDAKMIDDFMSSKVADQH